MRDSLKWRIQSLLSPRENLDGVLRESLIINNGVYRDERDVTEKTVLRHGPGSMPAKRAQVLIKYPNE